MVKVLVEDTSLTSLANIIRESKGIEPGDIWRKQVLTAHKEGFLPNGYKEEYIEIPFPQITSNEQIDYVDIAFKTTMNGDSYPSTVAIVGDTSTMSLIREYGSFDIERTILGEDSVIRNYVKSTGLLFKAFTGGDIDVSFTLDISVHTKEDIEELDPDKTYTPTEMVDEFKEIASLAIPSEVLDVSGDCSYRFAFANSVIANKFSNKINTHDISSTGYMFQSYPYSSIDFDINIIDGVATGYIFNQAMYLTNPPKLNGASGGCGYMFSACYRLREFPEGYWTDRFFARAHAGGNFEWSRMFNACYSLRRLPEELIRNMWSMPSSTTSSYSNTNAVFYNCYALDEIVNYPVQKNSSNYTSSIMNSFVGNNYHLQRFTFALGEDGQPQAWKAKGQTLDLSIGIGCNTATNDNSVLTNYNSGISTNKNVCMTSNGALLSTIDEVAARYQELKNDPDWFALSTKQATYANGSRFLAVLFSRYNHDSAVETINSLPDTSATGTNTIKFKNYSGACTDGGGINDLTAEEIAVASAKGWTVSIVN